MLLLKTNIIRLLKEKDFLGTSLVVQGLRLCTSNVGGTGSVPGRGTKIPHAMWHSQKKIKTKQTNKTKIFRLDKNETKKFIKTHV